MIRPCIEKIIRDFGFEVKGNEYTANFYFDATGNVLQCIVKENTDAWGLPIVEFHFFDLDGNYLSRSTLDQMIVSIEDRHMFLVPFKSESKYVSEYTLKVKVPVNVKDIANVQYLKLIQDLDAESEIDVVELWARQRLAKAITNSLETVGVSIEEMVCCGTEKLEYD